MNTVKLMNTMNLMMMQEFVVMDLKNSNYYINNKNFYTLNKKFRSCNNHYHNRNKALTNSNNNNFVPNYNKNFQKRNNYR